MVVDNDSDQVWINKSSLEEDTQQSINNNKISSKKYEQ